MQVNSNSDLVEYSMTDQEVLMGQLLNYNQKGVLQNERVRMLQELALLKPDSMKEEDKESYWQRKAYLRGQLDNLTHILNVSKAAELAVDPDTSQQ